MTDVLRVAGIQLASTESTQENLSKVEGGIGRAAELGARLVVFPEATMAPFSRRLDTAAEPLDGPFATGVREAAGRHGVVAVVGMFTPADEVEVEGKTLRRVHNTVLLTGEGAEEVTYRKIHLFDAFTTTESETVAPGDRIVTADVDGWTVGLATCFDVRFPDQFTELGRRGSELVVLPASWGDGPGKAEQWDLLVRARAHDAQAWTLGVGQAWTPRSTEGPYGIGRSALADPTGAVRSRLDAGPGILLADIDRSVVADTRTRVPIL